MINFIVAWSKRRKAQRETEQKARDEAQFVHTFIEASKHADDRRLAEQRAREYDHATESGRPRYRSLY